MATTVKYTEDQVMFMRAAYETAPCRSTVEELAAAMGRTVSSVIAKLSREGVYKAAGTGVEGVKSKAAMRKDEICLLVELASGKEMKSLKNMTRDDLEKLLEFIKMDGQ